jgi:hypothetical protein
MLKVSRQHKIQIEPRDPYPLSPSNLRLPHSMETGLSTLLKLVHPFHKLSDRANLESAVLRQTAVTCNSKRDNSMPRPFNTLVKEASIRE